MLGSLRATLMLAMALFSAVYAQVPTGTTTGRVSDGTRAARVAQLKIRLGHHNTAIDQSPGSI